ncbi:hypothetical protein BDV96DRAFT_653951 [Lophiotrema nucula]|uniref:Uncharacterized protein n=1 Tax=Lophiotrema nucula TaxID=690887 RepID=A0A6A5YMB2_9PLEO|nr:hypothetical protein BDV96DRAFT_653951 [Lophiotrema nucula]
MFLIFFKSPSAPLPLRVIHGVQLTFSLACALTTLTCLLAPTLRTNLTFALLSPWIFSSLTTTIVLYFERGAAAKGALDNEKYTGLQLSKMTLALFGYLFGIAILSSVRLEGVWWSGFLRQVLDGGRREVRPFVWAHGVNWLLLWIGLIYGCVMPRKHFEGRIRLDDDVTILLAGEERDDEPESDEALARALQAEEPGWEA